MRAARFSGRLSGTLPSLWQPEAAPSADCRGAMLSLDSGARFLVGGGFF